jgi:hypothetical protein
MVEREGGGREGGWRKEAKNVVLILMVGPSPFSPSSHLINHASARLYPRDASSVDEVQGLHEMLEGARVLDRMVEEGDDHSSGLPPEMRNPANPPQV